MLRTPFEAPPRKIQVGSLQPRNGFRVSRFRDGRLGGTNDCSVAWRRFGDERVGWFGSLVGRWVVHRWRPYRVECTGSLPTSEVKRRRARLVLGWGTAREDLRVLPALDSRVFLSVACVCLWFPLLMLNPASQPVFLPPSPFPAAPHCDTVCIWRPYEWIPFGDHPLKLERYRED